MFSLTRVTLALGGVLLLLATVVVVCAQPPERLIAVTFDDLPVVRGNTVEMERVTRTLLAKLDSLSIPAVGFVNEKKLPGKDESDSLRHVVCLEAWLQAGQELGNHTFSHADANKTPFEDYTADVLKGETALRPLTESYHSPLRYFRHPVLHAGPTAGYSDSLNCFLEEHGYEVAPVTIDNQDWMFAYVYEYAVHNGDTELEEKVCEAYIPYMLGMVDFFSTQGDAVFERPIPQVLLLHSNSLNAKMFDSLAVRLMERGYRFISLEEAMQDEAYSTKAGFTPRGMSWIYRWATTLEVELAAEPREPDWLREAYHHLR